MFPPVRNGDVGDWRLSDTDFLASFRLPGPAERYEVLAAKNPIPRERRIAFDEESHTYHVDGIKVPRSVTGWLHSYTDEFDASRAIESMRSSRHWEEKQERYRKDNGELMSDAEIAQMWASNGEVQRSRGQLLHWQAEQFLNGRIVEEPTSPEFLQFLQIHSDVIVPRFEVFRTEVSLFHCGLRLAGQADLLCKDSQDRVVIWDWKRSRQIRYDSFDSLHYPLQHLPSCNYWIYALQLNVYRYMLQSEYEIECAGMYLGVVHPDRDRPQVVKLPVLDAEISALVNYEIELGAASEATLGELAPFACA